MPASREFGRWPEAAAIETSGGRRGGGVPSRVRKGLCTALIVIASVGAAGAFEELATARAVVAPGMPEPQYLVQVSDPVFGTAFTRVTEPGRVIDRKSTRL